MRSMFFKRSRCRGRKKPRWGWRRWGNRPWGCPATLSCSRTMLHVAARGHQSSLQQCRHSQEQPHRSHDNRHHGGTFTRVSMATAQSLATATPPGGTRAQNPRQVFSGGGDR